MKRQALAIDVRDTAGKLAVARRPSEMFHLARRVHLLSGILARVAAAEAMHVLKQETSPPDLAAASEPPDIFA